MKRLTFEQMAFSRASDAWCPISGRPVGPNTPRVQADRILASVGNIPIYHRFSESQGFVRYSNEIGCYDRVGEQTHVYTDELDTLEAALAGVSGFQRIACGDGLSQDGRPLELLTYMIDAPEYFLVDTLIHGNEPDGVLGTLKAFELLMTHDDFAPLRNQFNIVFMPCCNPDGYYLGQRNINLLGPHPSGVDTGINLNRVWPWYWDEFVPTAGESKGDAPITCCLEATAMEAWRYNGGDPRPIAWALDQHATAGDGARYVSRDRCFRNLGEDDYEKLWADWTIWRLLRAVQARRVHEGPNPDLWVNYFRSRWRPHWHSYLSTLSQTENGGIPCVSMVGEHNKVSGQVVTSDLETYKSASDYNFDHIIAMALVAQGGLTERKAAVLIEHEVGDNQVPNSEFEEWSTITADGYRPQYWSRSRAILAASTSAEKHMLSTGRPVRASIDVTMELPEPDRYDEEGGADIVFIHGATTSVVLAARAEGETGASELRVYSCDLVSDPVFLFEGASWTQFSLHKQWRLGKSTPTSVIYLVGLGDKDVPTSAVFVKYTLSVGVWTPTPLTTHTDSLEDAGACLDHANGNLYIFGGRGAAADTPKVHKANCTAETLTEVGSDLLGDADYGMGSAFCSGGDLDGMIVLVGGTYDGELGLRVRVFDPSDGSLDEYDVDPGAFDDTEPGKPPSIMHCAVVYDGVDTVWFYGGEHVGSGDVYHSTWSIHWNGAGFDAVENHVLQAGLSDDGDPEDYAGDEEWIRPFRYWRGVRTYDSTLGKYVHMLFGGLERLSDGTDETDRNNMRGFYAHYVADDEMGRPADYNYGYVTLNSHIDVGAWDKANMSWSVRADTVAPATQSAMYARLNIAPGDSGAGIITTRRVRTYYMHPPQWWWRDHAAVNLAMARPDYTEDELRLYVRGYRQAQGMLVDAPMVQVDTLWPSSWSPAGTTRAVETATWADALDPRWFRLQLDWLPAAPFISMTSDVKLATIGGDEGSHFELWAVNSSSAQREYVRGTAVSTPEPVLRLWRVQGEDMDSIDVPCYWGGYIRDTALSRFDTPIQIEIWNHAGIGSGLVVRNGWAEGWEIMASRMTPATWIAPASVILHGGGWWAEPQTLEMDRLWKARYTKAPFPQGALLIGDRDPTSGQVSARGTFRYSDTFTRGDDANLGSNWDVIIQTGNGWNISSNQARCDQVGWERWIAYPYLRDCAVLAEVKAPSGGKVGLFTRLQWAFAGLGLAHGYAGYLHCTGAATANLVIARYYRDGAGVQQVSVLTTEAVTYTASAVVTLELAATGSTITLTMSGAHAGVATAVDTNHILPGAFGLFGETPGAGQYVWIDAVRATAGSTKVRITE
jgi:hypothetical protein